MSRVVSKRRPGLFKRRPSTHTSFKGYTDVEVEEPEKIPDDFVTNVPLSTNRGDAEKLQSLQRSFGLLDLKLQSFANAIRQLGSSVGLLDATTRIQERLPQILHLFQDNGSRLFKTGRAQHDDVQVNTSQRNPRRSDSWKENRRHSVPLSLSSLSVHEFPKQLESLADDLTTFIDRLNDVPEFVDSAVHTTHAPVAKSFIAFAEDLRYRADCLTEFGDKLDIIPVAKHINELTEDLGSQADRVRSTLHGFIEVGVPAIRYSQERTATNLQNLSTVATFFSAVTATTIQFSFVEHGELLEDLLNALWISSLTFSIASAMNAQLAYHWREATYRSPKCYVPWWILIWIVHTPLLFLLVSAIAFLIGLCVFTYSSSQSPAVAAVVTAFTIFTSFALLCVGIWFALERLAYSRTQGRRWLLQILDDGMKELWQAKSSTGVALRFTYNAYNNWKNIAERFGRLCSRIMHRSRSHVSSDRAKDGTSPDEEAQCGEIQYEPTPIYLQAAPIAEDTVTGDDTHHSFSRKRASWVSKTESDNQVQTLKRVFISPDKQALGDPTGTSSYQVVASPTSAVPPALCFTPGERRFARQVNAIRAGLFKKSLVGTRDFLVDAGMPKLRTRLVTQLPSQHIGRIGHLQFSPDGEYIVTCSWDKAAYVWKEHKEETRSSTEFKMMGRLVHPGIPDVADVGRVAWSPTGDQLVTQYRGSIALWNPKENLYYQKHVVRQRHVQSVVWMPSGSGFLSLEWQISQDIQAKEPMNHMTAAHASVLVKFDTAGRKVENQTYILERLQVWDLSIMPDEKKLVAVASLVRSRGGYEPINANHQKRILIYNLDTGAIESQMPLMVDVRGITLGRAGSIDRALVSYDNNAPQTWHIERGNQEYGSQLKLIKTYHPKPPVEFAGISYFGALGKSTWVLATSRAGEIYIWDPPSGNLIHTHVTSLYQELTGLALNPKSAGNSFMFASAMLDGTVNIWTTSTMLETTSSTSSNTDRAPNDT